MKVLVVDDEPLILDVVSEYLAMSGHEALVAPGGEVGLAVIEAEPDIQLLISDILMPKMTGIQLAERATSLRPRLKVLLISGWRAEMSDLPWPALAKPFRFNDLTAKIRIAMGEGEPQPLVET